MPGLAVPSPGILVLRAGVTTCQALQVSRHAGYGDVPGYRDAMGFLTPQRRQQLSRHPRYRNALGFAALALVLVTVTTVPLLQALGRRLLSMASGPRAPRLPPAPTADPAAPRAPADPADPHDPADPADPYDPGSLSAAFVTCPNEAVAKELARLEELGALSETPSTPELTEAKAALSALLCSWLDGYPEDFGGPQVPPLAERLGDGDEDEDEEGADADPLEILSFQAQEVAEELTLMEAELFLRLVPYECLGAQWSRRGQRGQEGACRSVRATVRQFNRLAGAVVRSCLGGAGLRPPQRARLLEKWIRVAEECRALRNFSSLCAIISALQSSPVHRLRQSWDETSRDAQRSYEELSAICSEQDNYSASRQLLLQAPQDPPPEPSPRRQPRRPPQQRPVGVVPYLGTFLRDLVMLDAAMKDELEDGYINFEKRRKFLVLAQVRGLQGLCRGYPPAPQPRFRRWLRALRPLPEARSHSLSCEIEPPGTPPPASPRPPKPALVITPCTELLSSVGAPVGAWDQPCPPPGLAPPPPPARLEQARWPSVSALAAAAPPPGGGTGARPPAAPSPQSRGGRRGGRRGGPPPPECRIIRARMQLGNGSLYKSILITSQDKTPAVVAKVLEKHGQDPAAAPRFQLLQLLPENRELLLPPSANVFYAMTGASLDFALRPPGLSATFPKIKATGRKITRVLF
ncbi:LOW QUALITY PROTEIN: ral guanine nucleotide dissociation stimulator-like 2 [Pelecanus crispus]|uniref:LOW QUALITY PROTEIN: ral guanine nucleotide dissociation stimulator-like 2 n=1 Tax=Pelecanus crispus TaxID=36300 RepID=UPI003F5D4735